VAVADRTFWQSSAQAFEGNAEAFKAVVLDNLQAVFGLASFGQIRREQKRKKKRRNTMADRQSIFEKETKECGEPPGVVQRAWSHISEGGVRDHTDRSDTRCRKVKGPPALHVGNMRF
jgi:hypothetical protein